MLPDGTQKRSESEEQLIIEENKHIFIDSNGNVHNFEFGNQNDETRRRYNRLKDSLEDGYFERVLDEAEKAWDKNELPSLGSETDRAIDRVMHGVQGQGKGIAGVLVCQLCIADIEPNLNTRLHKGGRHGSAYQRWQDGISLRSIDREYITPLLNQRNLLVGNASGGSTMTRMLSTNLPYSKVTFEGQMRGPTSEWLELIDMMENPDKSIDTNEALIRALGILYDIRSREDDVYEECISNIEDISEDKALEVITESVRDSDMRSELLELASYSAFLVDYDEKRNYSLERMTAHRAADAKSGRLGDIEIYLDDEIEELWDAKFERELTCREWEKIEDVCPNSSKGIITLEDQDGIEVPNSASVVTLPDVLELDRTTSSAKDWLKEYVECLGKYNIDMVDFNHNTESVLDVISESTE